MKALTPIITSLLILAIAISLVTFLWLFFSGTFTALRQSGDTNFNQAMTTVSSCMKIESVSNNKVFIRNCGKGAVTQGTLGVYLNDVPLSLTMNPVNVLEDEVGVISLSGLDNFSVGGYLLRVTNPNVIVEKPVEAFNESGQSSQPLAPVLDLELDESSGSTAHDNSTYHHDGTIYGASHVSGLFGRALRFDSVDHMDVDNVPVDTSPGGYNTVDFWMYWNGGDNEMPMSWSGEEYDLWLVGGCFGFNTGNNDAFGISSSGLSNRWVRVTAIFYNGVPNQNSVSLYIDGVKQNIYQCRGQTTGVMSATSSLQISGWAWDTDYQFNGDIDSLKVYSKFMTPDEMSSGPYSGISLKPVSYE